MEHSKKGVGLRISKLNKEIDPAVTDNPLIYNPTKNGFHHFSKHSKVNKDKEMQKY